MNPSALKRMLPYPVQVMGWSAWQLISPPRMRDSSAYWKQRAQADGQRSVMWRNEQYNELFRLAQADLLRPLVQSLPVGATILDIGCGIGTVARMMAEMNSRVSIDAIDFPEMVARAQIDNPAPQIRYVASSAEEYRDQKAYALIVSAGCFSAIHELSTMRRALQNCASMAADRSSILMIDPFHRSRLLARAKCSSRQVQMLMRASGFTLREKGGLLFWPYRLLLANSPYAGEQLRHLFYAGERWLARLGRHAWADYKVLLFQRD